MKKQKTQKTFSPAIRKIAKKLLQEFEEQSNREFLERMRIEREWPSL